MEKVLITSVSAIGVTAIVMFYVWRRKWRKQNHYRVEIKIHSAEVGHLIGNSGERIKDIIQKAGTKIKFILEDEPYDYCTCIIEGEERKVLKAQNTMYVILERLADMDITTCFIIKGVNNYSLSDKFNDSLYNEDGEDQVDDSLLQKSLVTDFVVEPSQKLVASDSDGFIPVHVSATASPDLFWVQSIKTKEYIELDTLIENLRDFYETNPIFNIRPSYADVKPGYICSTYSETDHKWYRTEVAEVFTSNETDANETNVDLYFLDYGFSSYQKIKNIREIPKKFLELKFQAIECKLSNVQPNDGSWSEDAMSFFDEITHMEQWRTLFARIDRVNENGIPEVTLIDRNSDMDVSLADELVNRGLAKYSLS